MTRFAAAAAERRGALPPKPAATPGTPNRARSSVLAGAQQSLNFFGPADFPGR